MKNTPVTEAHYTLRRDVIFSAPDEGAQLIADSEAKEVALHRHIATQLAALLNAAGAPEFANAEHASQWAKEISGLRAERDQLRAEVERLKSDGAASASKRITLSCRASRAETERNNLRADLDAIKAILNEEKARAERAEASLHALRLVCGTTDADKFSTWVDRANARAERAEAELDGIRALADRRNKRYHVEDTTHQLVAALDQALDIAQAELDAERARMADLVADLNDACITLESAKNDCDDYAMQNTAFKLMAVSNVLLQYIPNAAMKEGA